MSLFQNNVVKKYTNSLDKNKLDQKWQLFTTIFHNTTKQDNIRNSKEEQYQAIFLNDLFVQVLGYTQHPNTDYNLITEQKNETNSKKADGAIILNENVHAVIELKGTETTDLAKIENQAFGYKNNQKNCSYVIISNFEKLRFYIDNATENIEFNLFTLSRAEFDLLYTCLSLESMQTDLPKKIKNESVSNEDKITKELYKDYSAFRKELFTDIEKLNPQYDRLLLFKKTQKLLDRFLFIFFAEDRQLLPTNLIFSINLEWQKLREARVPVSLYDRYKMYFQDLNTGARVSLPAFGKHTNEIVTAQYDIYAYNGGLFQPDEILDTIAINDDLLFKHTKKLSDYDFESEVDVNILGHIFENSLNEIDEITNAIEGQEVDKTKTKRKKDGVFYTPKYITKYIVDNTIGKLCEEKKTELALDETKYTTDKRITIATKKKLIETLDSYRKWLLQLTIVDPACGSGAFLNQALEFLIAEHKYVDELQAKLFGDALVLSDVEGSILENNLFGVDLNEESVEIAKLSLWLRTAQRNRKLNSLNNNIKCGNSLIDDATIAGDKAFNWHNEFPQVFSSSGGVAEGRGGKKGGFDVVIGNPPYVFARDNFSQNEKNFYVEKYVSAKYQINTYLLFIEKSVYLLKKNGVYGLIIPNSWLMVYSGEGLRKFLLETNKLNQIINLEGYSFESANVETVILLAEKEKINKDNSIKIFLNNGNEFYLSHSKSQNEFSSNDGFEFKVFLNDESDKLNNKLNKGSELLDNIVLIKAGLKAYEKDKGEPKQTSEDVINRIYDYDYQFDKHTYKYLEGKDVGRYYVNWGNSYLKYGKHLAAPRTFNLFDGKKIIIREITGNFPKCIISSYSEDIFLFNMSNIAIIEKEKSKVSLKYILAVLNSSLLSYYFVKNTAKSVRKLFPKIILNDLRKFPIKKTSPSNQQPFIEKADLMLSLNKELQEVSLKFSKYFSGQFKLEKLSGKLEKWYDVTFEEFIKEINKAIKAQKGTPLTKKDEFDWIDLFEENKVKANALQQEIAVTDKAIDAMVYELYGLTKEEIEIVENS
jgi:type I restriction-modification system DNA methylase subunit